MIYLAVNSLNSATSPVFLLFKQSLKRLAHSLTNGNMSRIRFDVKVGVKVTLRAFQYFPLIKNKFFPPRKSCSAAT